MGKHMKKRIALIFTVLLFSVLGFSACGDPYKKMSFSLTSERDLTETVELFLSKSDSDLAEYDIKDSFVVEAKVSGVGKKISTDVVVPEFDEKVDISTTVTTSYTSIKITAKSEGETILMISPKDNPDGKFTKYVRVKVSIGLTNFQFKNKAIDAMAMGDSLNLNVDSKNFIDFYPSDTSQTDIEYSISYPTDNHDYAEIKNGVLYTYDSDNYPTASDRRIVTLVAKSPSRPDLESKFDIPIIKIDDQINVATTYGDDRISLDKNNNGKYEIILAYADINMNGGVVNKDLTNRILHIGFGNDNVSTSKYRISVVGEYSLTTGTPIFVLPYNENDSDTVDFLIKSNTLTNGTDVTFKIEYFGDEIDNPNNEQTLYEGLFTRYITVTFKVYSLPNEKDMTVNDAVVSEDQTFVVYDTYYKTSGSSINENGTSFRVRISNTTIPNIVANISYSGDGFDQSGLIFVGGTKTDNGITIANGESFYLRHTYTQEQIQQGVDRRPYITINVKYSFAPSNATAEQKSRYFSGEISKKVYLDFKAGVRQIVLNSQIGLEITSDKWQELFAFPEGYDARASVDQILGRNLSLVEIEYDLNKILIRANQQFETGEANLSIIATNGKMSNTTSVVVYLPVLYTENDTLLIDLDENDSAIFKSETTSYNYNVHSYNTYTSLTLANKSNLALDVYSISEEGGYLKAVMPNVNVTCEVSDSNILSWSTTQSTDGVLSGSLSTLGVTKNDPVTITFTLSGYKSQEGTALEEISISHTISIFVYDTISKVEFSSPLNVIYLKDALGFSEQEQSQYQYDWTILPKGDEVEYGDFEWEINLQNADSISHTISLEYLDKNALQNLLNSVFKKDINLDDYTLEIKYKDKDRLRNVDGKYVFDIYNSDLLKQIQDDNGNNVGYEAVINSEMFDITISPKDDKSTSQTQQCGLIKLFEYMFSDINQSDAHNRALLYIFNGNTSGNYREFVLSGQASQFGRKVYVETVVRVCKPIKVSRINVSVSQAGLYFEKETSENPPSQSFTYNVLPNNAQNTDIMLKIYKNVGSDGNIELGEEQNIIVSVDDLEQEESNVGATTVASATIKNGKISITISSGISGDYILRIIAKDSITQNVDGTFTYGVTEKVRIEIGDGSMTDPFQLRTIDSLIRMWKRNINEDSIYCYKLNNNINVQGQNFVAYVFNKDNVFKGDFDGNGKSIIGLTSTYSLDKTDSLDKTEVLGGLFAKYEPGNNKYSIHDLTLSAINYNITIKTSEKFDLNVGGLAGSTNGTIKNVYISGNININYADNIIENEQSTMYIGGIIGTMSGGTLTGTAVSSSFADDMTANVAMFYNGLAQGSHYFGGAIGRVIQASTINNVKVSSSIKAVSDAENSDTYSNATLGGLVGLVNAKLEIKDARITPTLSGYQNIGGVVGDSSANLDINHVVVEFLNNTNAKNYIMGRNNVGGFVGNATAEISLLNSYIRSFVTGEIEDNYDANKYCGNIIVRGDSTLSDVYAGGFVGNTNAKVNIERSYVMGDIKSYVGSGKKEYIGGFIGGLDKEQKITISDAYYDGKILTNKAIPNVLFGTDDTPEPTSDLTGVENISVDIVENAMTEEKNVGEYIKIVAVKTKNISYQEYKYEFETTVTISNFYASVNGTQHVWTDKNKNEYTLRTPNNVVESTLYMTFARMDESNIAFTGYKIVKDSNNGKMTENNLFETQDKDWFSDKNNQTNYINKDEDVDIWADLFKSLGFDGCKANVIAIEGKPELFVLNAGSFGNPTGVVLVPSEENYNKDNLIAALLNQASGNIIVNKSINTLLENCKYEEKTLEGTFDIADISEFKVEDLYGVQYDVVNKREVYNVVCDGVSFNAYKDVVKEGEISKIYFAIFNGSSRVDVELYYSSDGLYKNYDSNNNDEPFSNKFAYYIVVTENNTFVALYETNLEKKYLGSDGSIYYRDNNSYYTNSSSKEFVSGVYGVTIDLENCRYKVCDLQYECKLMFSNVRLSDDETSITFDSKSYGITDDKVRLASTSEIMAKEYNFSYTNGNVEKNEEGEYKVDGSGYVKDIDGHIVAKYSEGKFVFDANNASWILSDDVNSGMPALIRKLGDDEKVDSLDILYDAVASMNVKVTEFNYSGLSNLNPYKQGYIMLDESSVILFYNTPNDQYTAQNTYILASSDEKTELDRKNIGGQVPVVVDFSNVSLNKPFELTSVKDYSIKSSNPNIVALSTYIYENTTYTALNTLGTGLVTLTFTNRYDDTNTFRVSIYVVAGVTGVKETGNMVTYVQKTNTYSFGFDNTLSMSENSYAMDANVGGYTIKVVSFTNEPNLTFNGVELNEDTTETYEFDMSNAIVIYGEKAGKLDILITPFVKYGNNQKYILDYLSKTVTIEVQDIAKSISTGSNTATTIKPESTVKYDVEVISSSKDEKIITYITDRDGNIYTYGKDNNNLFALADIYVLKTNTSNLENNLYKITYTVYVELNDTAYYKYYIENNFDNPLEDKLSYSFEFVPESWLLDGNIMVDFKDKTASYTVNIEGNDVSSIITSFYNTTDDPDNKNGNENEEEKVYIIDSNAAYVNKLAPGNIGLLRLKVSKDYNNLSYLAVRTTNSSVTLLQANATTDSPQKFSHIDIANTPTDNGIKLWNIMYYTDNAVDMNYVNYYYVFVIFDEKITSGSVVDLQVTAYGKGDNQLIPTVMVSVEVDYLPQIKIVDAYGDSIVQNPIGEYRRIYINTSHVEDNLSWKVETKVKPEDNVYGFIGKTEIEKTTYKYEIIDNPDSNKYPYICYNNAGVYEKLPNNFTLDMISGAELYIYIPSDTYLGKFNFSVTGYRIINTVPTYTKGEFVLNTMLFEIEDITIDGATGGVINLPVSEFTTLSVNYTLNSYAQAVYRDYKNGIDKTEFAKYLYNTVEDLRKSGAGQVDYDSNKSVYNGWRYVPEKGETNQMEKGHYYPSIENSNFVFFYENFDGTGKYGVTALKISRNTIEYKLNLKLENGIYALYISDTPTEIYKPITFTLQITDNSTADHPIPIYNSTDFMQMLELVSEEQVNQEVSNNSDVDPTELVFGNYILLADLTLENWIPRSINVSSFDGNGFTITIKSWNFNSIIDNSTASAGLFTKIGEYTVVKNLNIDISPLLSDDASKTNAKTKFEDASGKAVEEVTFGVVAAENAGVLSNIKVVSIDGEMSGKYLNIWTQQGYSDGELCTATIAGFVASNSGAISDCFVGLNAVVINKDGYSYIPKTQKTQEGYNTSTDVEVYPFTLVGGNNISGFVNQNSGTISNSYVMGVSIKNQTERSLDSMTAGFVNENANSGSIYSCFVSGSEYSEYGEDIVDLRATKTEIYSKGNVGGFVYENQGTIENAYSIMNIIVQTVNSGGFAYSNISNGVIKNAYTTSTTSNINSLAHGMFVYLNTATLQNAYYLLIEGEKGITSSNKPDDVLKKIDPANAIVSQKPSDDKDESDDKDKKDIISFANAGSFEGFTFASGLNSYDGIWYLGEDNKKSYPQLVNTINYNITSVRTLANSTTSDDASSSGSNAGSDLKYNYTYVKNYNIGSEKNPIVISQPAQFAQYIVANTTKKVTKTNGESIYVFGGVAADDSSTYAPAYVRIINNISLAKINLSNIYSCNDVNKDKIPLSKVVFGGYLIGNGMTISDITLNNTSTSGNNLEDFGLFKQIGLSESQRNDYYDESEQGYLINPVVYNIKFSYNELSDRDANKVGLLAGSIYGGSIMNLTIEGKKDAVDNTVSTITGHNLVGAVAGLIQGDVTLTDITIKNVRVNATRNTIDSLSDSYNDSGSYYESFVFGQNKTSYKKIEFENNTISNLSQISYAGGIAGVIIANNLTTDKGEKEINGLSDMSTYTLSEYQNVGVKIHDIVVKDNVEISGDMAGGLFGYAKNTHIRSSAFLLMQGANNTTSYQRIFGRAFGGGLIGQTDGVVLERTNIYHADEDYQNTIDTTIAQITSDSVSKNDLFLKGDIATTESVSVAIGGMVGLSKDMIVLDSYSKVNVYNPKSKIAGGMIGYAEGKNGISYSFTYGNVKAKEVIGGLIGFYRYNSFDLYLNNAFALNVWSSDVKDTLKTNLTAVYGSRYDYTLRMPEIGNQMSEYSDGSIKLTGKTNSVVSDGNSTFTYIGSVLGKATLNNGIYKAESDDKILEVADGKLVFADNKSCDTAVKNLFIRGDEGNEIINSDDTGVTAVRLFTSTTTTNGYSINIDPVKVNKVVYNRQVTVDNENKQGYVDYYTYIGNQFYNVYSSLYGVTTRTGSASENNLDSHFDGLDPNNKEVDISLSLSEDIKEFLTSNEPTKIYNKNAVRYSTIFGTQYAISQITGYFQKSNYIEHGIYYRNLFNDPSFTNVFSKDDVIGFVSKIGDKEGDYLDYVTATNSKATSENLSSWYYDESTGLLRYRVGSDGSVKVITTHQDLIEVLNSNTKGKKYELALKDMNSDGKIPVGGGTNARFSEPLSATIIGRTKDDTNNIITQKVKIYLDKPEFETILGAYISDVEFHFDLSEWNGTSVNASNYNDGSWGLFALQVINSTFKNCTFVFDNVNMEWLNTYNISNNNITNTKYAGLLFGRMTNSTLTGCKFEFNVKDDTITVQNNNTQQNNIIVQNTTSGFGAIAGMMSGGSIEDMTVKINKPITVDNGGFIDDSGMTFKSDSTVGFETNVGGLIGIVNGANISNINDQSNSFQINVTGTVRDGGSTVGGLFGSVSGGSSISNCNYYNNMDVNVKVVSGDKSSSMSIGGVIGKLTNSTVSNCYFNGSMDANNNYADKSDKKSFNVSLTNNTQNTKLIASDYVGGVVGQISGYNNSAAIINRVPINVTINADGSTATDNNIYVGGIFGADTNSNSGSNHSNMFVTGDITVKLNETHDNLYVGGVIGKSGTGINDSYMQGDITVDGAKTTYAGGIVGAISNAVSFSKCVMYGDIRYTLDTTSTYYLAGIVGGRIVPVLNDSSEYKFTYCTVLASIYEVQLNSSVYDMVTDDTEGNKYSSKKYSGLNISPFISGINVNKVTIGSTDFYIIEDYFDFYYDKESKSDEVENGKSTYGTSTIGKYYYDIYSGLNTSSKTTTQKILNDVKFGNATYAFTNHYFFGKTYGNGTKYNPNILSDSDTLDNTISGYNIITTANKEAKQDASISISDNITINRNAVLANKSTNGITFTGGKTVTNNGVIENIVFDWDGAINTNNGVLNNVVAYGVNEDTPNSDTTMYGLVGTNNGFIYRSGAIIVYTGLTKLSNTIKIGGLVFTNNNLIGLSYCSSMLTGLKYDESGKAYVIKDEKMTDDELNITSGGIAYTNSKTIEDSLFNGTLYGGKQSVCNIAKENSGKIQNTYSDKNSMYYADEQTNAKNEALKVDTRFHTANSNYTTNYGRPYVTGGIIIDTTMGASVGSKLEYFGFNSKNKGQLYPVFNITDFNNIVPITSSKSSSNKYKLLNDLYVGYTKDVYKTQNLTGTFYGNGYSIVSSYDPKSSETQIIHSQYLFSGSPNICDLSIHNFSTSANAILGDDFKNSSGSDRYLKNITVENCDITSEYTASNYNSGVLVGTLTAYMVDVINVNNTSLNVQNSGGVIGEVSGCTITQVTSKDNTFTANDAGMYVGGIVGLIYGDNGVTTISSCKNMSNYDSKGKYGGIVCWVESNSDTKISDCKVNTSITSEGYVGGIIACIDGSNGITLTLTNNTVDDTTTITGEGYAGGVVGYVANSSVKMIALSGGTYGGTIECSGYAGGIAGAVPDSGLFTFTNNAILTAQVKLGVMLGNNSSFSADEWNEWIYETQKHSYWYSDTRFSNSIPHDVVSDNLGYTEYSCYNYEKSSDKEIGYAPGVSLKFKSMVYSGMDKCWYSPNKEYINNRVIWYERNESDDKETYYDFQSNKLFSDGSQYVSNIVDTNNYYSSLNDREYEDFRVASGIVYGIIEKGENVNEYLSDEINDDKIAEGLNYKDSLILGGDTNTQRTLRRYTQWFYIYFDKNKYIMGLTGVASSAQDDTCGIMVMEYNMCVNEKDLVGGAFDKLSSEWFKTMMNGGDDSKQKAQAHAEMYVAYDIRTYDKIFNSALSNYDWNLSSVYKIKSNAVLDKCLYEYANKYQGIARLFFDAVYHSGIKGLGYKVNDCDLKKELLGLGQKGTFVDGKWQPNT